MGATIDLRGAHLDQVEERAVEAAFREIGLDVQHELERGGCNLGGIQTSWHGKLLPTKLFNVLVQGMVIRFVYERSRRAMLVQEPAVIRGCYRHSVGIS